MKNKTCKDCKFISKKKKFDVETNKSIDRFYCKWHDHHLKVFNPCEDFEQRKIVEKEVFDWDTLCFAFLVGIGVGLISLSFFMILGLARGQLTGGIEVGLIVGLLFLITCLGMGLIFGFTDKKKIYKDSNIDEENDEK